MDLTAQINGSNSSFSTAPYAFIGGTLVPHLSGQRLREGVSNDYVETGSTSFSTVYVPRVGDTMLVQFEIDTGLSIASADLVIASGIDPAEP